jgi:hypothetical protein
MSHGTRSKPNRIAGLLAVMLLAGCASATRSDAAAADGSRAVMCSKCETVWVERPDPTDLYLLTYRTEEAMRCPDCVSRVRNFFSTGAFEHTCSSCDGVLMRCTRHVD